MRKIWMLLLLVLLTGCRGEETMETIADVSYLPVMASPAHIQVLLPEEASLPVLDTEQEQIYLCGDAEIILETRPSGDLSETVRYLSGFEKEELTLIGTEENGMKRYAFVWASAGEQDNRLGRAAILDDGNYHYCLSVVRDTAIADQTDWEAVFSSFSLVSY